MDEAPLTIPTFTPDLAPPPPAIYDNSNAALAALQEHARWHGYAVATRRSYRHGAQKVVDVACAKGNALRAPRPSEEVQRKSSTSATGCPFKVQIRPGRAGERHIHWTKVIEPQHNHAPSDAIAFAVHRRLTPMQHERVSRLSARGMTAGQVLSQFRGADGSLTTLATQKDLNNAIAKARRDALCGQMPIDGLLQWLPENGFLHCEQYDAQRCLKLLFITTSECLRLARAYGQVYLLDCTYKTNRFRMPLLNIVGFTADSKTFTIAWCFMFQEQQSDYVWALQQLKAFMTPSLPRIMVTDRELALMNAIRDVYPEASAVLCVWHIRKNILANCKDKLGSNDRWETFNGMVNDIINAPTIADFDWKLADFKHKYGYLEHGDEGIDGYEDEPDDTPEGQARKACKYVCKTWFGSMKVSFCKAWTNGIRTFNCVATSRVEGSHSVLKRYLHTSQGSLNDVMLALDNAMHRQQHELSARHAISRSKMPSWMISGMSSMLFRNVAHKVSIYALRLCWKEFTPASMLIQNQDTAQWPCNCHFLTDWGIPCRHQLVQHRFPFPQPLEMHHFDRQWHLLQEEAHISTTTPSSNAPSASSAVDTSSDSAVPESDASIMEPPTVRPRGRPRGSRTRQRRDLSHYEHTERRIQASQQGGLRPGPRANHAAFAASSIAAIRAAAVRLGVPEAVADQMAAAASATAAGGGDIAAMQEAALAAGRHATITPSQPSFPAP